MKCFWTELIGLQVGERPPFPFNGVWVYSDNRALVHIAEQKSLAFGHGAIAHVALEGADYKALLDRLGKSTYAFTEKVVPLSDELQVFILGPDGLTVEMIFPLEIQHQIAGNKQNTAYKTNENLNFLGGEIL